MEEVGEQSRRRKAPYGGYKGGGKGHGGGGGSDDSKFCYHCRQVGYTAKNCPLKMQGETPSPKAKACAKLQVKLEGGGDGS